MSYKVDFDGTHIYDHGNRYKPLSPEERTYGVNKPDDPRAVRFHGEWFLPLKLLPERRRKMPETQPDDLVLEHMSISVRCKCRVCTRPDEVLARWRRKWRREQGLRS